MPIGDKDVRQSVIVEVLESRAPTEVLHGFTKTCERSNIGKLHLSHIVIKRVGVSRKVRDEEIKEAIAVVIANGDAHSGLRPSGLVQPCPREHADFRKGSVAIVMKQ